jgi:hypothetical protein
LTSDFEDYEIGVDDDEVKRDKRQRKLPPIE